VGANTDPARTARPPPRRVWAVALLGVLLVLMALPALLRPGEFLKDDSYFYLQVAHNVVAGAGSTFHGITPTNGYHPLWMLFTVAATWLGGGDKATSLQVTVALQLLLSAGAALLFVRLARRLGLDHPEVGVAVLLLYLFGVGVFASEAHLNALLLTAALLSLWHALERDRWQHWAATGVLMGLAILARLDNLFVAALLCGLAVLHDWRCGWTRVVHRMALTAGGTAVLVVPYLLLNWHQYGHLMPISGAIKSTFPAFDFDFRRLGEMGMLAVPFGIVSLGIGLLLDRDTHRRVIWCGLGAGVLVHALYVVGFTDHYTFWAWYYVSGVLAAALCAAHLPGWLARQLDTPASTAFINAAVVAATLLVVTAGAARAWLKAFNPLTLGPVTIDVPVNEYRWPEEFAVWMKRHLPPDSIVFVYDWPGALAFYSDLRILPMDGLVSDFAYNDELLAQGARQYLCAKGVRYYFGLIEHDLANQDVAVPAPLYRRPAGTLPLREERLVIKTRDVAAKPDETLPFAIWQLDCAQDRTY
jgi:hypothetical protein